MSEIVVLGSLNVDFVANVTHLPDVGETIQSDSFSIFPGGKGANQAIASARMGGDVSIIGAVGKDDHGDLMEAELIKENINVDYLKKLDGIMTGIAMIEVDKDGNNRIVTHDGANEELSLEDVEMAEPIINSAKVAALHWDVEQAVGEAFIKKAYEAETEVILNLAPVGPIKPEILKLVNILIVNEVEAKMLSGIEVSNIKTAYEAGRKLIGQGIETVIVTLGADGVVLITDNLKEHIATPTVTAVDTTAAGDTFVGSFTKFYLKHSLSKATELACSAASLAVTKEGAIPSIPNEEALYRFMKRK